MADYEHWIEQYSKEYSGDLNLETGEVTDQETGRKFKSWSAWQRYVQEKRSEALKHLLERRDFASDVQQLPGTKPLFLDDGKQTLSNFRQTGDTRSRRSRLYGGLT